MKTFICAHYAYISAFSSCSDTSIVLNGMRDDSSIGFMRLHCGQDAVVQSS